MSTTRRLEGRPTRACNHENEMKIYANCLYLSRRVPIERNNIFEEVGGLSAKFQI